MLLLPDQTYEEASRELLTVLRLCDDFLSTYRIRPEFFCRYRERLAALHCQELMSAAPRPATTSASVSTPSASQSGNTHNQNLQLFINCCTLLSLFYDPFWIYGISVYSPTYDRVSLIYAPKLMIARVK